MNSLLLTFSHNGKFPLFTLLHDGYLRAFSRQTCAFGSLGFLSSLSRRRRRWRHRCLKSLIVVPMLLEKIPDTLRLTITKGQNYFDWALGDMLNALLVKVELREDRCLTQPARVTGSSDNRRSSQPTANALFTRRGEDSRCPFCLGGHQPDQCKNCLLYTSPSPRDGLLSRMPSSA